VSVSVGERTAVGASVGERTAPDTIAARIATDAGTASPRGARVWLPVLTCVASIGLLLVAIGYTGARSGSWWSDTVFWLGVSLVFAPIAARLVSTAPARRERIALVAFLGLALYAVKVLHSPLHFTFYDELLHLRTIEDIARYHHLFHRNPLLPVSARYPGLETIAAALMDVGHLPVFWAAVLVIGAARLLMVVSLYLLFEEIGRSARLAGVATLLYMANPGFVFFDAQFAYESLALPLVAFVLYLEARRARRRADERAWLSVASALGIVGVILTHHVTSYVLSAFLLLWSLQPLLSTLACETLSWFSGWTSSQHYIGRVWGQCRLLVLHLVGRAPSDVPYNPIRTAVLALLATFLWLDMVAAQTVGYLGSFLAQGAQEIVLLIYGESAGRSLFHGFAGDVAPLWEQFTSYAAVGIVTFGLPVGLLLVWRRPARHPTAAALAFIGLAYPASQALRLTPIGLQVSGRSVEFLFLSVAFLLALVVVQHKRPGIVRTVTISGCIVVVFFGGIILGWPRWARTPGPYLVSADARSIEPEDLSAALWARAHLGLDNHIAADRVGAALMGSYGQQDPVTLSYDNVDTPQIFFPTTLTAGARRALRQGVIKYIVVDRRLSRGLPVGGVYFELGEPDTNHHATPIPASALTKFLHVAGVWPIFDSGNILIFRVGAPLRGR